MRSVFSKTSLFWPLLVTAAFASWFVATQPGPVEKDALEYENLAQGILHGSFSIDGIPSMIREPGYPLFRAALHGIGVGNSGILWVQVLVLVGAVWMAAATVRRIDARLALPTAWLSALAYGMLTYAASHYGEAFTTFVLALTGYVGVRAIEELKGARSSVWAHRRWLVLFGVACGALALTRATYEFLGVFVAFVLIACVREKSWRERAVAALTVFIVSTAVMAPWIIRNGRTLGSYGLTQRAGVTLYARSLKAAASWQTLGQSYASALFGQATVVRAVPTAQPIVRMEHWGEVWRVYGELQRTMTASGADAEMSRLAMRSITSSPERFVRFIAWTPVETWRLLALPSPLSPTFRIEAMFIERAAAGPLGLARAGLLALAHLVEWLWIAATFAGLVLAFRRYGFLFMPGLLLAYTILIHLPVDAIERYAVPVTPWRMACIGIFLLMLPIWKRREPCRDALRSADPALIEAANAAYHEIEAKEYDDAHPEILWCERAHWEAFGKRFLAGRAGSKTVVDVGAGTGFIGTALRPFLGASDRYVAVDLSPEMLEVLRGKLADVPFRVETIVASAGHLPMPDGSVDVVAVSSVFHHLPDPEALKAEAVRLLKPGGLFVVMHEPNARFSRSWFMRQVARATSVLAAKIDRPRAAPTASAEGIVRTSKYDHVNAVLAEKGLIRAPLSQQAVQALVDVHSPTAKGRFEPFGFDALGWASSGPLKGCDVEMFESYNYLGKLDPSARAWRRLIERLFCAIMPHSGSLFTIVLRKPEV